MIIPVILAGGSGTRLWPASRKSFPKQFTQFEGAHSLFQTTLARMSGPAFAAPTVVTGTDYRFIVRDQIDALEIAQSDILLEPMGRNTAPAILTAALHHAATPEAVLLVAPSDHQIRDAAAFNAAIMAAAQVAAKGAIVTFGITPNAPETGFGYLALSQEPVLNEAQALQGFVEKPAQDVAEELLAGGRHMWNAGIFMFRVDTILAAFEEHAPEMMGPCRAAHALAAEDLGFVCLDPQAYSTCNDISVDYAVMERANGLQVVPVDINWSDMGSWRAVRDMSERDENGNALRGSAMALECKNTLLSSDNAERKIVGLGLDNIAAIATDDAILVANLDASEQVKDVVAELKIQAAPQAESFRQCHRPWGHYETLSLGERFQVKRICVKPGGCLSLQSHVHRAEHWVVVEGTATVTVGDEVKLLTENQSVYIPLGAVHRLQNEGKLPLTLIEVQSGAYLGEDDIVRYEDIYARVTEKSGVNHRSTLLSQPFDLIPRRACAAGFFVFDREG